MTLRKKFIVSNVLMVVMPILLTLALCAAYVGLGGSGLTAISRTGTGDYLSRLQGILSTLESGLSGLGWDVVRFSSDNGLETVLSPRGEAMVDLESLGFHLRIETPRDVLFSNVDEGDERAIEAVGTGSDGSMAWHGSRLVIQDGLVVDGMNCRLIAVYDERRADGGSASSVVPLYTVEPRTLAVFAAFAVLSVALTAFVLTRWLDRSVAEPLDELRAAADRVAAGDLDRRIDYPRSDEFGDVCAAFDGMRVQLKEAEAQKARYEEERRELLQGVSHDLRSPLTSIVGYASGIKDGIADTDEKREAYCDAILTRAADLGRMVDSLSVLTRSEGGGALALKPVEVGPFMGSALDAKSAWLESNRVAVSFADESRGAEVLLDEAEMRRVVDNLLENTVRHRDNDSSRVSVKVGVEDGFAEVVYADDGPGVPEEHIGRIFDSFYRADESRTRQGDCSGLGLAIVKRIVEEHGGEVSAHNEDGLTTVVRLPVQ